MVSAWEFCTEPIHKKKIIRHILNDFLWSIMAIYLFGTREDVSSKICETIKFYINETVIFAHEDLRIISPHYKLILICNHCI